MNASWEENVSNEHESCVLYLIKAVLVILVVY